MASLKDMWAAGQLDGKHSAQLIALAGDGNIHTPATSSDLRAFLHVVTLEVLQQFARECLENGKSQYAGYFLQDIINELGLRLGFDVLFGRYTGTVKLPAPDGTWRSSSWGFIVEVKTTDAYRIKLDSIARYRRFAADRNELVFTDSSMLIVVGREDTGELEAQVRGSKHAWDLRLIGVEALFKLALLHRDSVEQEAVLEKIRAVLRPQEYTRVDGLLDVVFETAKAVSDSDDEARADEPRIEDREVSQVDIMVITAERSRDETREVTVAAIGVQRNRKFKKMRRSLYESLDGHERLSIAISKNYGTFDRSSFWYAFHTAQRDFIEASSSGFAVFACEGLKLAIVIPVKVLSEHLNELSQTATSDRKYWHIFLKGGGDRFVLETKSGHDDVDVTQYVVSHA